MQVKCSTRGPRTVDRGPQAPPAPPRPGSPACLANAGAVANARHEGRYLVIASEGAEAAETLSLAARIDSRGDALRAALRRGIEAALLEQEQARMHAQLSVYRAELEELERLDVLEDERCFEEAPRRLDVIRAEARGGLRACEAER